MLSTPTWTPPFLWSPWRWWRNTIQMVLGFGTHISVIWRYIDGETWSKYVYFWNKKLCSCPDEVLSACADIQESRSLLLEALSLSKREGFCLGVKLVRGAYMDKERKLAEKEGRLDPIHQSWEDTNDRWVYSSIHLLLKKKKVWQKWTSLVFAVITAAWMWCWGQFHRILNATGSLWPHTTRSQWDELPEGLEKTFEQNLLKLLRRSIRVTKNNKK